MSARRLQSADGLLGPAVAAAVAGLDERFAPAARLAAKYAQQIDDDPELLARLGPPLLAALVQLELTPRSQATRPAPAGQTRLAAMRSARGA